MRKCLQDVLRDDSLEILSSCESKEMRDELHKASSTAAELGAFGVPTM